MEHQNKLQLVQDLAFIRELANKSLPFPEAESNKILEDVVENLLISLRIAAPLETSKTFYRHIHNGFEAQYFESEAALKRSIREN